MRPSPARDVALFALRDLDIRRREALTVPAGTTVLEMVHLSLPGLLENDHKIVRVTIGDCEILPALWRVVRPKPGATVVIRVLPAGNSRQILGLVVTIAAVVFAQALVPAIAASFGAAQGGLAYSAISAATTLATVTASSLLLNALIPVKAAALAGAQGAVSDSSNSPSQAYSISGMRNALSPGGIIPNVLGRHRFAPPYAALPYTESSGDDQYVIAAFNFGYGPLEIDNVKIGENSIDAYSGVEFEIRQGYPDDPPLTLYPQQVFEESIEASAVNSGDVADEELIRITARDVTEASIDIVFPQGLVQYDGAGNPTALAVQIRVRQRPLGEDTWSDVTTLTVVAADRKTLRRSFRWVLPERGQWEVGVTRITANFNTVSQFGQSVWSTLRSFRPEYPINFGKPLALLAVRIKATGQLNGIIDDLNADPARIALDWDAEEVEWIERVTRNPASLYRYILQSNANQFPKGDPQINLEGLAEWHDFCVANGLTCNRVHDFEGSLWDALSAVAAAGRARPYDDGEKWGVVVDGPKEIIVAHLSPRNSWGFNGERAFFRPPDAFRVTFLNERDKFRSHEVLIPWPGFEGEPDVTEELPLPGVTDPAQIFREARRRQYELIHRADRFTINQDMEHLVLSRGDLTRLSHDVLDRMQTTGRVKAVHGAVITLDAVVNIEADVDYVVRFRLDDGTSLLKYVQNLDVGLTDQLEVDSPGTMPGVGDLGLFGPLNNESREVIVQNIERGDNLTARLTLLDYAPQIDTLVAADPLPDWALVAEDETESAGRTNEVKFISYGPWIVETGHAFPPLPPGWQPNDIFLLIVQSEGGDAASTPGGWSAVPNSPQFSGDTRTTVFWRRATASEVAPGVTDTGNHTQAIIACFRGCPTTGDPWDVTDGDVVSESPADQWSVPGLPTTVENTKVVLIGTNRFDIFLPGIIWAAVNAGLSNVAVRFCANFPEPAAGGITIITADRAAPGTFGNWTLYGINQDDAIGSIPCISIALKPAA